MAVFVGEEPLPDPLSGRLVAALSEMVDSYMCGSQLLRVTKIRIAILKNPASHLYALDSPTGLPTCSTESRGDLARCY
ncbi:MAG: hypothetical protein ACR2NN_01180 [Bryobacteraceae bacterium]